MPLQFERPLCLILLPLVVLPWLRLAHAARPLPWLALLPADPWADAFANGLRALATIAIACAVVGIASPFFVARPTEHVGRGAQIVFVVDRSLSMDQPFGNAEVGSMVGVDSRVKRESKGTVARRMLAQFTRHREHDLLAMLEFSTVPIRVSGFTNRANVVDAAIAAANLGHGIAETDVGRALIAALAMFHGQPYNGSRVILLVSDGGARLSVPAQEKIALQMKQEHVALYWLYLRTANSPGLLANREVSAGDEELVPEHFLHEFFTRMDSPYHVYEAENPDALANAMADVDRLQSLPIRFSLDAIHHDLGATAFAIALACAVLMAAAGIWELRA